MRVVAVALLAGCAFHRGSAATAQPDDAPGDQIAMHDTTLDVAVDALPPNCKVADSSLVLCLELDEPGLAAASSAIDGSGRHHDPALSGVAGVTSRTVPSTSQAITLTSSTDITLAQQADFDLQHFTLSAWVRRNAQAEMGVFDTGKQYTMSLNGGDGTVECAVSNQSNTTGVGGLSPTGSNEWDLVACTYDGAQFCSYSFRNGSSVSESGCIPYTLSLDTNVGNGSSIGEWVDGNSHFTGTLDQVRVYSRALSAHELCVNGGLSGC